ncbi:MAG: dihydropteroate synthase [Gemmatimonadaceae bacterium]|nr:dihydropteroate synthase [Gemmatimonadaceae bacterium]
MPRREDGASTRTPPAAPAARWRLRDTVLDLSTPQIMAICNVTPDSFSDGGERYSVALAVEYAASALRDGATIIDIGGESTRPGARAVPLATELDRVLPVLEAVREHCPALLVSVDTTKAAVARAALAAGAHIINDVSAGRLDPQLFPLAAETGAGLVLMHSRGAVSEMATYVHAAYGHDPVPAVLSELGAQVALARAAGVTSDAIVLDPGLGFAKTPEHSLALLRGLARLGAVGYPLLVGASRKRFIGLATGVAEARRRVIGSVVAHVLAVQAGARIVRTHDVAATREALAMLTAVQGRHCDDDGMPASA